jgi:hypothetical protein
MDYTPAQDAEHLRLLGVFHYVLAGIAALFALFPILHLILGLAMVSGVMESSGGDDAAFVGWMFILFAGVWIVLGLAFATAVFFAGRSLLARRNYTFCLVMGGVSCLLMPVGTVLGVFTIIVLMRESVKQLFEGQA